MNRSAKPLLFIIFTFCFAQSLIAQPPAINFNRSRAFDVQHYLIRTDFDRKNKAILGETTISLKPLKAGFNSVRLDAADLNFESVRLEPNGTNLKFKTAGEEIIIALGRNYSPKELIRITLKYSAKPKKGVYFVSPRREGAALLHDAQIWTQGEPEETRHWFPAYDFPDDKATTEQFLTVEAEETAISNGQLIETIENKNGTKTFHFRMNAPHSVYLTSFVVGKFVKITDSYKNLPLAVYLYPGKEFLYEQAFSNTKEMLRVFEELTGVDYPFNKYDQTIVGQFKFGGMENITATTLSDRDVFFAERNRLVVEDLISHEISHAWFGNLVTHRNWAELWLNEGFATFMEAAYREKVYGREDYLRKIAEDRDIYFAEEAQASRKRGLYNRLARPDDSIFDAVTYQKGGVVLHTLRETVGEKTFRTALNVYLNRHKFANVETRDLQQVFEDVSQQDLDWFFAQWVYGTSYPRLDISYKYDDVNNKLAITIEQTQKAEELTPAAFILPLEVEITTPNGVSNEKLNITKRRENFSIALNAAPTKIVFDRDLKIPLKTMRIQKIL